MAIHTFLIEIPYPFWLGFILVFSVASWGVSKFTRDHYWKQNIYLHKETPKYRVGLTLANHAYFYFDFTSKAEMIAVARSLRQAHMDKRDYETPSQIIGYQPLLNLEAWDLRQPLNQSQVPFLEEDPPSNPNTRPEAEPATTTTLTREQDEHQHGPRP